MITPKSQKLRDAMRAGFADCPHRGQFCDRTNALHAPGCIWQQTIRTIYKLEREAERIN